jgi:hypothetical protein
MLKNFYSSQKQNLCQIRVGLMRYFTSKNKKSDENSTKWFKQRRRKRSLALYLRLGNKIKNGNSGYAVNGGM